MGELPLMAFIYEGRARPLFYTEGLGVPQAEALIVEYGLSLDETEKIGLLYYQIIDESVTEITVQGQTPDMDDAEMDRDGDYIYVVLSQNEEGKGGKMTSALQKATNKIKARYGEE